MILNKRKGGSILDTFWLMYLDSYLDMNHSLLLLPMSDLFMCSLLCTLIQFSSAFKNCYLLIKLMNLN
jgi:hypothetical protein